MSGITFIVFPLAGSAIGLILLHHPYYYYYSPQKQTEQNITELEADVGLRSSRHICAPHTYILFLVASL